MNRILTILVAVAVILLIWALFVFKASASQSDYLKVICHHTPANQVTLTFHNLQSYIGHLGTPHSGQTYDTDGACQQPTPTPTKKPCKPTPTPTLTPTPTEPVVTPTPTETPVESHSDGPKGDNRGDAHTDAVQTPQAPTCTIHFEKARVWYTKVNGKVVFNWATDAQGIEKFSVTYGYSPDKLVYGVDNIPSTSRSLEIKGLTHSPVYFNVWTWISACSEVSNTIDP